MCTASKPKVAETPAAPEPVKTADEEVMRARETARNTALRRYGLRGTDVTGGSLESTAGSKQKTLGA